MPSKPKKAKSSSWIDVFKSTRGDPIPPKKVIPVEDRPSPTEADWDSEDDEELRCVFCGEVRDLGEFHDGLRCDHCVEEDEEVLDEYLYSDENPYEVTDGITTFQITDPGERG